MKRLYLFFLFFFPFVFLFGWTTPERLTHLAYPSELSENNARNIVFDQAKRIHIVWASYHPVPGFSNLPQVWYKRYEPSSGWTKDTCIADVPSEASDMPALCLDSSGNLHIVYVGYNFSSYNLRYKRWQVSTGWTQSEIISTNTREKANPSVAATTNGNIHCVWSEMNPDGYFKIFYRERVGSSWPSPPQQISSTNETDEELPSVSAGRGDSVYVVWRGEKPVNYYYNVFYRARLRGIWGTIAYVCGFNSDQCDTDPYGPSIILDNSNVGHIA